jgi:tetratricopeptide (TPR) repeat protein
METDCIKDIPDTLQALLKQVASVEERCKGAQGNPANFVHLYRGYDRLATYCFDRHGYIDALVYYMKQYHILHMLSHQYPENTQYLSELSDCCSDMGDLHMKLGHAHEAIKYYTKMHGICASLMDADINNISNARNLATAKERLGSFYLRMDDAKRAGEYYDAALLITERLILRDSFSREYQIDFSALLGRIASEMEDAGHMCEAEKYRKWHRESELLKLMEAGS